MSELPLILGVGLGGIGIGTIIAAGYLYSRKDKEEIIDVAKGIASTIPNLPTVPYENIPDEQLTAEQKAEKVRIKRQKSAAVQSYLNKKSSEEESKRMRENAIKQSQDAPKIAILEKLYRNIQKLDEELQPLNNNPSLTPEQKRRQSEILSEARGIEKQIKKYDEYLRQFAKNNLAMERDRIAKETPAIRSEPITEESEEEKIEDVDYYDSEEETPEEDFNLPIETEDRNSFSSNPAGGSKYFTLTYTPKKVTKKYKLNSNKRKSKRNKINKRKTKRNKK